MENLPRISNGIDIGIVRSVQALLAAIEASMPRDAILYLEDARLKSLRKFLDARSVDTDQSVEPGTAWPKANSFHIALTDENLAGLRLIAEHAAAPEVCSHLVVYREYEVLLEAYDAGFDRVVLSSNLSDSTIQRFEAALKDSE